MRPVDRCSLPPYRKPEEYYDRPKGRNDSKSRLNGFGGFGGWDALCGLGGIGGGG